MDEANIDNVVVNLTGEEEISDDDDSPKDSEDTWNVNPEVDFKSSTCLQPNLDGDVNGFFFSQAIQPPCCNQMERLSISSANTSVPPPNIGASEEMVDDLLQGTPPIHESSSLGTNADNEGKVFDDFPESEDEPRFEFTGNSKLQCSHSDQSLRCADLGEGSKSVAEKGNKDRISELTDASIHHIFSFLNIGYVLQTCLLSRRWRYLWLSLPTLRISENSMAWKIDDRFEALNRYIVFVDRLLLLRDSSSTIKTFKLKWENVGNFLSDLEFKYDVSRHIVTWIMAAVKHNVQELNLTMWLREVIKLPDCLFTCKSLTTLGFYGFGRDLTAFVLPDMIAYNFPRLRYLELKGVSLGDENLTSKLFSSCPGLESLVLTDCSIKFDFSSLGLKHFHLDNCDDVCESTDYYDITVKLSAPKLTSLICKDYMSQDYSLENLSSLVTADIGMKVSDDNRVDLPKNVSELATEVKELYSARMVKFIRAVSNVTDLTLSSPGFLEVVSESLDSLGDPYLQFSNLRFLKVETWVSSNCINTIAYLVRISPNIESIFLTIELTKLNANNTGGDWIVGSLFPCLHYLKIVQIRGTQGCLNELKFLQALLKKAIVLEKVTLFYYKTDSPKRATQLMGFKEMLLAYPSASPSVSISIQLQAK
ncbi:F-box/LRR-repeat protein At3g59190-like [Papaver somniferum]|uniref:F-box/LRR-repeat protein At3g59190-like n=1 Tax=Papaver somniferum TaxID=3469 RepID=UPI000E704EDD|nr:F-box/LRR-repeat protein At3g59190-like [Papaver somniferum]